MLYLIFRIIQRKYTIGVVGVVFNTDGKVLLVEHVLHPKHPWGLPGGWLEAGEDPAETIARELQEELALIVDCGPILLTEMTNRNHLDIAFMCYANGEIGALSNELLAYQWILPQTLPRLRIFHQRAIQQALVFNEQYGMKL